MGNLTQIDAPGTGTDAAFTYDDQNRMSAMVDASGTTNWQYWLNGEVEEENGPWTGDTVSYGYDALGRRTLLKRDTYSGGVTGTPESTTSVLDYLDRVTSLASPAGTFYYGYVSNSGLLASVINPNNSATVYGWESDEPGRMTSSRTYKYDGHSQTEIAKYTSEYDARDLLKDVTVELPGVATQVIDYSYDDAYQLTREKSRETVPLLNSTYNYTTAGNRQTVVVVLAEPARPPLIGLERPTRTRKSRPVARPAARR